MPDHILQLILQALPTTEEVVRTSILSTRWSSLEVLRLSLDTNGLHLPDSTSLQFRALRVLELNSVNFDSVEKIVGRSPLLEVSCPELVSFECVGPRGELVLENLVSLKKSVILPQDKIQERVLSNLGVDLCEVLAGISHVESLTLDLFYIQGIDAVDDWEGYFPACFPNLKTLELTTTIDAFAMNVIMRLLRCSPNLESLHLIIQKIDIDTTSQIIGGKREVRVWVLMKTVKFLGFNGKKRKLFIARYLLEHGKALEEMAFSWSNKLMYDEKSMKMMNKLSKYHKASPTPIHVTR